MSKRVRIALEMDSHFVRLLNANVALSALREKDELQPIDQLALIVLCEARGAFSGEVHANTSHAWRGHIDVVPEMRSVANVVGAPDREPEKER